MYTYQRKHMCYFVTIPSDKFSGPFSIHLSTAQYRVGFVGAISFTCVEYFCSGTNLTLDVTTPAKYTATALPHRVGFGHVSSSTT